MFSQVIDAMIFIDPPSMQTIQNLGVYYETNKQFFSEKNNEQIGYDDNRGLYMFAVKGKIDITQLNEFQSCGSLRATQRYTLKFITDCNWTFWLMKKLQSLIFTNTYNIDDIVLLMDTITETRLRDNLFLTEFDIILSGSVNDCDYSQEQCCCT
jgi:hypothetical protein